MIRFVLLSVMAAAVSGIIISQPVPLTYTLSGGYASQYAFPTSFIGSDEGFVYKFPQEVTYQKQDSKHSTGSQYSAPYPTVHHPAEYTYASPPVRHAEPIDFPVPPELKERRQKPQILTYTPEIAHNSLLGVAYSPATDVSRMTYFNGYGIAYGY